MPSLSPATKARRAALEAQTRRYVLAAEAAAQKGTTGPLPTLVTIPVVVHVVYNTAVENVSDAVIQAQIAALNAGFRMQSADALGVPTAFRSLVGDVRVNFCLATRDSSGNPSNGITRTYTARTIPWGTSYFLKETGRGGKSPWDPQQYLSNRLLL